MSKKRLIPFFFVLIAVVGLFYLLCIHNSIIVNDDYQALYTTWMMSLGLTQGIDFNVDSFSFLFDIFYPFYYIFGETVNILFFFRFIMLCAIIVVYSQIYTITKKITSKPSAFMALLLLSVSTPMYMRGLDLRPDLFILICWLQTILILSNNNLTYKNLLSLGILTAIAFLFKFKSLIILVIICISFFQKIYSKPWTVQGIIKRISTFLFSFLIINALYILYIAFNGGLKPYFEKNFQLIISSVDGSIDIKGLKISVLSQACNNDFLFWILFLAGMFVFASSLVKKQERQSVLVLSILLALLSVAVNPHYHSYNLIVLYPLLTIFVAVFIESWNTEVRKDSPSIFFLGIIVCICSVIYSGYRLYDFSTKDRISHQLALNKFIRDTTSENDAVFAYEGIGLFRPSIYHWRTSAIKLQEYYNGKYTVWGEMKEVTPKVIILNYRIPGWLTEIDKSYLSQNYIEISSQVMSIGYITRSKTTINLLNKRVYEIVGSDGSKCALNGKQIKSGTVLSLTKGKHTLESLKNDSCVLKVYIEEQKIETLKRSNKDELPYLVSPFLSIE